ncbi:kynureninase [Fonticula alba]|uniref:Kynureninase n=1 Tax=Fonticula alba TaxID=691883 RepID=A0A058Z440_FONAL|nr:kynureninase [Fonticula alba]KCV69039.1 kynureninase [Fonticula alba]|eukprot:XP_009496610.1 kynureninase [Fonticula alba]
MAFENTNETALAACVVPTAAELRAELDTLAAGLPDATPAAMAAALDAADPLAGLSQHFTIPALGNIPAAREYAAKNGQESAPCLYLCGHSLGLMPTMAGELMNNELSAWGSHAVLAHFDHPGKPPHHRAWVDGDEDIRESLAIMVGARYRHEVISMNALTVNLHLMMAAFYRPTATRFKILCELGAFPSDWYAIQTQIRLHGRNPDDAMIVVKPRDGERILRLEDIKAAIDENADSLAMILLPGAHHLTGQQMPMAEITAHANRTHADIRVGFDLAHAAGAIPLALHAWGVDFAAWCTYKYMNAGPGSIGGVFVHDKWADMGPDSVRLSGWIGHSMETRFRMDNVTDYVHGAPGFVISNASPFALATLRASLVVFDKTTPATRRAKSIRLAAFLHYLLEEAGLLGKQIGLLTSLEPAERGGHVSLLIGRGGCRETSRSVHRALEARGVLCDFREPDVIRVSPQALYSSYADVLRFVELLKQAVNSVIPE